MGLLLAFRPCQWEDSGGEVPQSGGVSEPTPEEVRIAGFKPNLANGVGRCIIADDSKPYTNDVYLVLAWKVLGKLHTNK
jgi:hypothetical protein